MRKSVNPEMLTLGEKSMVNNQKLGFAETSKPIRQAENLLRYEGGEQVRYRADACLVLAESLSFPEDFFCQDR